LKIFSFVGLSIDVVDSWITFTCIFFIIWRSRFSWRALDVGNIYVGNTSTQDWKELEKCFIHSCHYSPKFNSYFRVTLLCVLEFFSQINFHAISDNVTCGSNNCYPREFLITSRDILNTIPAAYHNRFIPVRNQCAWWAARVVTYTIYFLSFWFWLIFNYSANLDGVHKWLEAAIQAEYIIFVRNYSAVVVLSKLKMSQQLAVGLLQVI